MFLLISDFTTIKGISMLINDLIIFSYLYRSNDNTRDNNNMTHN